MVFIVSFEVVALIVSAVLGGVVLIANATKVVSILFLTLSAGIWGAYALISLADEARRGRAADVVVSLLGFAAIASSVSFFSGWGEIQAGPFLWMALLLALSTILLSLFLSQRPVVRTVSVCACIVLALLWSIGFDYSYGTKVERDNIAYYKMLADGKIMDTARKSVWGATTYYDPETKKLYSEADGHFIANYEKGKIFYPVQSGESSTTYRDRSFIKYPYYAVQLEDGQTGFVFSGRKNGCNVQIYYYDDSDLVAEKQERLRKARWYGILPEPVLNVCEKLFEAFHPSVRMYLIKTAQKAV